MDQKNRQAKPPRAKIRELVWLLPPFAIWLVLFRRAFPSRILSSIDGWQAYNHAAFYFANLARGVYPMWNPFWGMGRPNILSLRVIGEVNPFLYIIPLLRAAGLSMALAYSAFLISYFFLGLVGFYCLAKRLFSNPRDAGFAFLLLLFSTMGGVIVFSDPVIILVFVPAVWFFYFLVSFAREQNSFYFLGITFTAMLLAVTYIPYYFLTVFLFAAVLLPVLFLRETLYALRNALAFVKNHKRLAAVCLLLLCLSLAPGALWYLSVQSGDFTASGHPVKDPTGTLPVKIMYTSNMGSMVDFTDIFSGLDHNEINLFYVPLLAYLVLWLSSLTRLRRTTVYFLALSGLFFLLACGRHSPLHGFLFEHIGYFRQFRNLHFFIWLALIPSFILLCAGNLSRVFKTRSGGYRSRFLWPAAVLVMHLLFAAFLFFRGYTGTVPFVTLGLSLLAMELYFFKPEIAKAPLPLILFFLAAVIQPAQVFTSSDWPVVSTSAEESGKGKMAPLFSFSRPDFAQPRPPRSRAFIRDSSGLEHKRLRNKTAYWGSTWTYLLGQKIDLKVLSRYARHKFLVYDRVETLPGDSPGDFKRLERAMAALENTAFVAEKTGDLPLPAGYVGGNAQVVQGNGPQFEVTGFSANRISLKTRFDDGKFLVYNDSYYPGWRAFINGKEVKLFRANFAFKGLWIPAGEQSVELRFGDPVQYAFSFLLIGVYFITLLCLLRQGIKQSAAVS